jgi:hypothetical protein
MRDCEECGKHVFYADSQEELARAAVKGKCVTFYS